MNSPSFNRILVFQTAFLGDAILSIPLLKALRRQYPQARIGFVCRNGVGGLFSLGGLAERVFEVDKTKKESLQAVFEQTKSFNADLIVSAHRSFRTALWVRRLGAKVRVGFQDPWSVFAYNRRVRRPREAHDVLRQLSLLTGLNLPAPEPTAAAAAWLSLSEKPEFSLKMDIPDHQRFSRYRGAVVLAPGSQWNTKRWTDEGYVSVARRLLNEGRQVVLVGTPGERALCEEISKQASGVVNLCGETNIIELAQLLKVSSLLICNDSGTMHVAIAVGTPVVSVFGPTVPAQGYAPWSRRSRLLEIELACRPCGAHGHQRCPLGTHECMKKVTGEMVLQATKEFLQ